MAVPMASAIASQTGPCVQSRSDHHDCMDLMPHISCNSISNPYICVTQPGKYCHTMSATMHTVCPQHREGRQISRTHPLWTGVQRGLFRHCPVCGEGKLLRGFLKVSPLGSVCAANNGVYPSGDLPPYATIVIVGHVVVPLFFRFYRTFTLPPWIQFATWLPLTALLTIGLLPFVKGGVIGQCWATGTVRPDAS